MVAVLARVDDHDPVHLTPDLFDVLSQVSGFLNGNLGVTLIMAAALYLNFKLPRGYRTRLPILFGAIATTIILILFAAISAWGLYNKLL